MPSFTDDIQELMNEMLDPQYKEKKFEAERVAERKRKIHQALQSSFLRRAWNKATTTWNRVMNTKIM